MWSCSTIRQTHGFARVREDSIGVTREGVWATSPASDNMWLTLRGAVRVVSRERPQIAETEQAPLLRSKNCQN